MYVESIGLKKSLRVEDWPVLPTVNGTNICIHIHIDGYQNVCTCHVDVMTLPRMTSRLVPR
jgi:hypothetical protein